MFMFYGKNNTYKCCRTNKYTAAFNTLNAQNLGEWQGTNYYIQDPYLPIGIVFLILMNFSDSDNE